MWDVGTEVFNQEIGGCDFSISISFHNNPKKTDTHVCNHSKLSINSFLAARKSEFQLFFRGPPELD
jgi:hypothetical protein